MKMRTSGKRRSATTRPGLGREILSSSEDCSSLTLSGTGIRKAPIELARVEGARGELREGLVGLGEYRERPRALERLDEARGLQGRGERREPARGDRGVNDVAGGGGAATGSGGCFDATS